jgi:hypothetical protein
MAGLGSDTSPGNIRQVLASNSAPTKNKTLKGHETISDPSTFQVEDQTYFLNKGELVNFQGNNYSEHKACIPYCISQHNVSIMYKALINRGAKGDTCGDDMIVLEGSERFVYGIGLAGHKAIQLISILKGDVIATFHQMTLLGRCNSILSCLKMGAYGADIND